MGIEDGAQGELAGAVVGSEGHAAVERHREILVAVVVEVEQEGAARVLEPVHPGGPADFLDPAVRALEEEAVGQAGFLAEVEVVERIAVDVADREAGSAEEVEELEVLAALQPVVVTAQDLIRVAVVAGEDRRSTFAEEEAALPGGQFEVVEADAGEAGIGRVVAGVLPSDRPDGVQLGGCTV